MSAVRIIDGYAPFASVTLVAGGLSGDNKFRVVTAGGERLFLRISDAAGYDRRKAEYSMAESASARGVPTPRPRGFGLCRGGAEFYALYDWVEGRDAAALLPDLSDASHYALGRDTGKLLCRLHEQSAPSDAGPWGARHARTVQARLDAYRAKPPAHSDAGELFVRYLETRGAAVADRPQTAVHGDYNAENLLVASPAIYMVDFNAHRGAYGDPWYDLANMAWMPEVYPRYQSGQLDGYFGGRPPAAFWDALAYYLACTALAALTDPHGLNGLEDGTYVVNRVLDWTDGLRKTVPSWYAPGPDGGVG